MNNTITLWRAEHAKFAKLIDLLEAQLALFHAGEPPNYELMLSIAFYMTHYVDAVHHAREEIAFRRIRQREPRSAPTIDALTARHAEMKVDGEALAREFEDVVDGTILARSEVEALGRRYIDGFRAHMKCEDDEVIPLAGTVLTDRTGTRSTRLSRTSRTRCSASVPSGATRRCANTLRASRAGPHWNDLGGL
jgi:hemerythrin-like domain-containing protein